MKKQGIASLFMLLALVGCVCGQQQNMRGGSTLGSMTGTLSQSYMTSS